MPLTSFLARGSETSASNISSEQASFHLANNLVCSALEHSDNIVLVLEHRDGSLRIVSSNKEAQRVTGYSSQQLVGRPFDALVQPEAEPAAVEALRAAAREGRTYRGQMRCLTRAGQSFWFGLHLMPADKPAAGRFVVLGQDITEKLRREAEGKAIHTLLAKVFVMVDAPVYIVDLQGCIVMNNPALDRLVGLPAGKLVGSTVGTLYSADCLDALVAAREKQNADGLDFSLDMTLLRPNSEDLACRITVSMAQKTDLQRFRIVTVRANASAAPAATPRKITAAGRIQLIGLEEVRHLMGPRWEALKDRAMAGAESVLRRRLGPHDTFSKTDDSGFIVSFADANEEEAALRAAAIGNEIRQRLIGTGESPESAHVFSAAVAVPPEAENVGATEFAAIVKARVGQRLGAIQDTARTTLARLLQGTPYEAEPVHSRDRGSPVGWCVRFTSETRRAVDVAIGVLPAAETATLDLDVMLLGFAHECAVERALHSPGSLVFVTLSSDILLIRKRMESCLEACRAVEEKQRKQLVLVVTAPAEGASRKISNGLPRLRSFCRFLGVAVERFSTEDVDVAGAGISFVLVDAAAPNAKKKVKACADKLREQRCRLLVYGADGRDAASFFEGGAPFVSITANGAAD